MNNSEKDGGFVKLIPGFRKHFPKAASPRHEFINQKSLFIHLAKSIPQKFIKFCYLLTRFDYSGVVQGQ